MRLASRGTSGFHASFACRCATLISSRTGTALLAGLILSFFGGAACAQSTELESDAPPRTADTPLAPVWSTLEPWRTDRFFFETSVYTRHFHYDPAHDDQQKLILGEWNITEQWLMGAAFFDNSFGQPSQLVYGGLRWRPFDSLQPLYLKFAAGLVHGYTGQYQNKIPFNHSGIAPVIVPSIGYCINRFCSELVIFGTAGALVTVGVTVP